MPPFWDFFIGLFSSFLKKYLLSHFN